MACLLALAYAIEDQTAEEHRRLHWGARGWNGNGWARHNGGGSSWVGRTVWGARGRRAANEWGWAHSGPAYSGAAHPGPAHPGPAHPSKNI